MKLFIINLGGWHLNIPEIPFELFGNEEVARIGAEIFAAVSGLHGEKAPGPNGFPITFWFLS